jgi:hypothetical protein
MNSIYEIKVKFTRLISRVTNSLFSFEVKNVIKNIGYHKRI